MACLDTDFLIDLDRKDVKAISKLRELAEDGELLYTTVINVAEYYAGIFNSKKYVGSNNNKQIVAAIIEKTREYLHQFSVLMLDEDSALLWGRLYAELKSNTIGDRDLFIASIALANKQSVITRNKEHFERISGLQVEGW